MRYFWWFETASAVSAGEIKKTRDPERANRTINPWDGYREPSGVLISVNSSSSESVLFICRARLITNWRIRSLSRITRVMQIVVSFRTNSAGLLHHHYFWFLFISSPLDTSILHRFHMFHVLRRSEFQITLMFYHHDTHFPSHSLILMALISEKISSCAINTRQINITKLQQP